MSFFSPKLTSSQKRTTRLSLSKDIKEQAKIKVVLDDSVELISEQTINSNPIMSETSTSSSADTIVETPQTLSVERGIEILTMEDD